MINYSLPTGKVVQIPIQFLIDFSDEELHLELENLMAFDMGHEENDQWDNSYLRDGDGDKKEKVDTDFDDINPFDEIDLNLLDD